jgi:hypothetical protein
MPLQIRRGPTADRLANIPLAGELVYDTTTASVYVGNGTTAGGLPVTNFSVGDARSTAAKLFLGDSLSDNTVHSGVTFAYVGDRLQATVQQDLSNYIGLIGADQGFAGNLWADDSGLIVNSETRTVYGNFVPQGNIIPDTNIAYDLGTSAYRFRDLYLSGSSIYLGNAVITSTGTAINFPLGSTVGGQALGINEGDTYNITISGNVIGTDSTVLVNTETGQFNGDLYGSVFGFDSSILVDARDGVLRGTLIGSLQGNVTGDVTGNASSATVASTIALTETNTSAAAHYITFVDTVTGNEQVRTDTGLTYFPSTNTLSASIFSGNVTGSVTGNIFTSLIDSADSSAITVTPAMIFNSDVTFENELFVGGDVFPSTSESYNLGSYTKKFNKLYLTEGANALWIGNATISGNGTVIDLPAGSTVGGSAIPTSIGSNASTITTNVTSTNASHYITFFDDQAGDNAIYTDSGLTYNPFSNTLSATNAVIGTVTGNLIGSVSGSVVGDVKGSIFADNSTLLVDAVSGEIPAAVVKGTFEGNVVGNVTGNVTGSVIGDLKGSVFGDDSALLVNAIDSTLGNGSLTLVSDSIRSSTSQIKLGLPADNITEIVANSALFAVRKSGVTNDFNNMTVAVLEGARLAGSNLTTVQTGDAIGAFNISGFNGSDYIQKVFIIGAVDSAAAGNTLPGKLLFGLHDAFGNFEAQVSINSRHHITAPVMRFTPFADTTARDTALPAGVVAAGMVIYLQSTNKLQVNNNGTTGGWVDLH